MKFEEMPTSALMRMRTTYAILAGLGISLLFPHSLLSQSVTIDLPLVSATNSEVFSEPPLEFIGSQQNRVELPLLEVGENESIFVTIVFFEEEGRTLSASWRDFHTAEQMHPLVENLAEGIAGWNQRTIQIPDEFARSGGTLVLNANSPSRVISRVAISRVQESPVFNAAEPSTAKFVSSDGRVFSKEALSGSQTLVPPDAWLDGILEAYLQENIAKADGNIEFVVPLSEPPEVAVFRVEVAGLSGAAPATVWINGVNAGRVAVEMPDLRDPGYLRAAFGGLEYAGWRKGSVEINAKLLRDGDNTILLEIPQKGVFLKNALLQMQFSRRNTDAVPPTVENSDVVPDYVPPSTPAEKEDALESADLALDSAPDPAALPELSAETSDLPPSEELLAPLEEAAVEAPPAPATEPTAPLEPTVITSY